jgi:hypothetical protein
MHIEVSVKQIAIKPGNNCNHAKTVAICRGEEGKMSDKLFELERTELI